MILYKQKSKTYTNKIKKTALSGGVKEIYRLSSA